MNDNIIELHFIDGPLQGTRKIEDKRILSANRTYRHLQPQLFLPEQKVENNTNQTWLQKICIEYHYLPFRIPNQHGFPERYAMVLEQNLR